MKTFKRIKWNHVAITFMVPAFILINLYCIAQLVLAFLSANVSVGYNASLILLIEALILFFIASIRFKN